MGLYISFLHNADPHFAFIGIRADEVTKRINWEVVIDFYTAPISIKFQFDDVFSFRIVYGFSILVLWINVVRN